MATNKPYGDGHRIGQVTDRSQTYNPLTEKWVKRDTTNGRFMDIRVCLRQQKSRENCIN